MGAAAAAPGLLSGRSSGSAVGIDSGRKAMMPNRFASGQLTRNPAQGHFMLSGEEVLVGILPSPTGRGAGG